MFVDVSDGFPNKKVWMGVGGWGEHYPRLFWIFGIILTLQILLASTALHSVDSLNRVTS